MSPVLAQAIAHIIDLAPPYLSGWLGTRLNHHNHMNLQQLTEEMERFVEAKGWNAPGSPRPQTPRNLAASLSIEAAEVLEQLQWSEAPADRAAFGGELADVALYLLQLASVCGVDLQAAILAKLAKNHKREWQ